MTMRRDVREQVPPQAKDTRHEGAAPGKRTLVESVFDGHRVAEEAAKGGTDAKARSASGQPGALVAERGPAQAAVTSAESGPAQAAVTSAPTGQAQTSQVSPATGPVSKQERVVPRIELGGSAVSSNVTSSHAFDEANEAKQQRVAPTGSPTFNGAAGSNDCTPGSVSGPR
jgi:hypothetical protein